MNTKENTEKLLFTCGADKKGDCGKQIEIILPKYLHYETELNTLRDRINEGINWNTLGKYLDVDKEIKEQDEKIETTKEAIKYIEELFMEINIKHKQDKLQTFPLSITKCFSFLFCTSFFKYTQS